MSTTAAGVRTAKIVIVYDTGDPLLVDMMRMEQSIHGVPARHARAVGSWEDFDKAIGWYSHIDRLIVIAHGTASGEIEFGGTSYSIGSSTALTKILSQSAGSKKPTTISEINFEACEVGRHPVEMWDFGRRYKAKTVTAWTWYRGSSAVKLQLDPKTSQKQMEEILRGFGDGTDGYYVYKQSAKELVRELRRTKKRKDGSAVVFARTLWFTELPLDARPPFPSEATTDADRDRIILDAGRIRDEYRPEEDKTERTITTRAEAETVRKDFERNTMSVPFQRITVELPQSP